MGRAIPDILTRVSSERVEFIKANAGRLTVTQIQAHLKMRREHLLAVYEALNLPTKPQRYQQGVRERVLPLAQQRMRSDEIASATGLTLRDVRRACRQLGITPPRRKTARARSDRSEWIRLYEGGWSTIKIADHFGCTAVNVSAVLRRRGVKMRAKSRPVKVPSSILAEYESGVAIGVIAERYKTSTKYVYLKLNLLRRKREDSIKTGGDQQ